MHPAVEVGIDTGELAPEIARKGVKQRRVPPDRAPERLEEHHVLRVHIENEDRVVPERIDAERRVDEEHQKSGDEKAKEMDQARVPTVERGDARSQTADEGADRALFFVLGQKVAVQRLSARHDKPAPPSFTVNSFSPLARLFGSRGGSLFPA